MLVGAGAVAALASARLAPTYGAAGACQRVGGPGGVGHWLRLGSPETEGLTAENVDARQFFDWQNMDLSGYFQMEIMRALED